MHQALRGSIQVVYPASILNPANVWSDLIQAQRGFSIFLFMKDH